MASASAVVCSEPDNTIEIHMRYIHVHKMVINY